MCGRVRIALLMGLLVAVMSSVAYGAISVAKEFTLQSYAGSPFRPRISGDWVLVVQNIDNKGCGSTAAGIIIYNVVTNKSYMVYSGNAGWCDMGGSLGTWTGKTEDLKGFCTLKGDRSGSRNPSNLVVVDTRTWRYYTPPLETGPVFGPVACGDLIAYEGKGGRICYIDMNTGAQTTVSRGDSRHANPATGPDLIVWEEYDNKRQVRGYRISTGEEIRITDDAGAEHCGPQTDGKTVVWWGNSEGVGAYDLATGTRKVISKQGFYADVDNGIVVYLKGVKGGSAVFGYDLATGEEFRISSGLSNQGPSISGNRVVWLWQNKIVCAELKR